MLEGQSRARRPLWLYLALLEIKGDARFALSFTLSLAIGLIGFLAIDSFQRSLTDHMSGRSRSILAADLGISTTRPFTADEEATISQALPQGTQRRYETGLMSMAASAKATRLVEVRAIDGEFPFYGALRLRRAGLIEQTTPKDLVQGASAWVYPELLVQLQIELGDKIKIGESEFTVTDVIDEDPSVSAIGFQIAPKVFIGQNAVADTGLLQKGSRIFRGIYLKLPTSAPPPDALRDQLEAALPSKEIRIRTHQGASEDLSRVLAYLNDYLGLVALFALFLAAVGAAFLFRGFLERRAKDVAILLSLGADRRFVRRVYTTQLALLGAAATLMTLLFAAVSLPALPLILNDLLPTDLRLSLHPLSVLIATGISVGGSVLFCRPLLSRLDGIQPAVLFQEAARPTLGVSKRQIISWLPALVVYWLLACWQAHSWWIGSLFVAVFLCAGVLSAAMALGFLSLTDRRLRRVQQTPRLAPWLAALNLSRRRPATLASFLAISLGALLIAVIPQIRTVLAHELEESPGASRPSLFLFDIQDEQVASLQTSLAERGSPWRTISPMVRAELEAINGEAINRQDDGLTRESEQAARSQNRGYNLTYREALSASETMIAGRAFSGRYDPTSSKPAEISLEQRFAERLKLDLGDRMLFDVQGVKVEGEVVSLRRVRWTSFEPNFFVQFQGGVLEEAPKTWIAALPAMEFSDKISAQMQIVAAFPNISIIDVSATIGRILAIVEQMSAAILFMAVLSMIAGLAVLFSIARYEADSRTRDIALLKVLGANFPQVRSMIALEFTALGFSAALVGSLVSVAVASVLTRALFDRLFIFDPLTPLVVLAATSLLCLATGFLATARSLRLKPRLLLGR